MPRLICFAGALCTGSFTDSVHTRSGFGVLHLHASPKASDAEQMFAMGYLEGWLTAERVYDHYFNMRAFFNMTTSKPMQWCASTDVHCETMVRLRSYQSSIGSDPSTLTFWTPTSASTVLGHTIYMTVLRSARTGVRAPQAGRSGCLGAAAGGGERQSVRLLGCDRSGAAPVRRPGRRVRTCTHKQSSCRSACR